MTLEFNEESALVLLRCLNHGQSALTQVESDNGLGELLEVNINMLRKQIVSELVHVRLTKLRVPYIKKP